MSKAFKLSEISNLTSIYLVLPPETILDDPNHIYYVI